MKREVMKRVYDPVTKKAIKEILSCGHEYAGENLRRKLTDERDCRKCGPEPKRRTGALKYGILDIKGRLIG